jgi:hypothetical protein
VGVGSSATQCLTPGQKWRRELQGVGTEEISSGYGVPSFSGYHDLHGITRASSEVNGPVISCMEITYIHVFIFGTTTDFLQAPGTEFSVHIQLYTDSRKPLPAGVQHQNIQILLFWPGDMLVEHSNAVRCLHILNGAIYTLVTWDIKFRGTAPALSLTALKGSQLLEPHTKEKVGAVMQATLAWDVLTMPPTNMACITVW